MGTNRSMGRSMASSANSGLVVPWISLLAKHCGLHGSEERAIFVTAQELPRWFSLYRFMGLGRSSQDPNEAVQSSSSAATPTQVRSWPPNNHRKRFCRRLLLLAYEMYTTISQVNTIASAVLMLLNVRPIDDIFDPLIRGSDRH